MSWISLLYETYENLSKADEDENRGLIPVAHATQKTHIEVTLDVDGEFVGADFVVDVLGKQKNLSQTLIPVTEKSANRSGKNPPPHPLCDKLKYLAGDYKEFCGEDNDKFYNDYLSQLEGWVSSQFSNDKAEAIYNYIKKGTLVKDLVEAKIFSVDEGDKLTDKWENSDVKLSTGKQADAFIRFRVIAAKSTVSAVWQDKELQNDFVGYYLSDLKGKDFCYVTGTVCYCPDIFPSNIIKWSSGAKLISSKDKYNLKYHGRFLNAKEAVTVSDNVSQKAHNALKWLIAKQGERVGDKVFLLWGTHNENLPDLNDDTDGFFDDYDDNSEYADTKFEYSERFNKAILGYKAKIDFNSKLAIIGLDAATTGRLSIIYYREYLGMQGNDLIDNIKKWHQTCEWYHRYKFKDKKLCPFYGAPSPYDIALCAYGTEQNDFLKGDDKIIANTVERILPCISDGAKIPRDIVNVLVQKSFHPQNYNKVNNWRKVMTVTCSMYKKYLYDYNEGEVVSMSIDKNSKDISYKCGRLLAVADSIESWVLRNASDDKSKDIRITNAMRYYTKFSRTPCETWRIINEKLNPYKNKLGSKGSYLYSLVGEISGSMSSEEFAEAKNLDGRMALGFDSQRQDIIEHAKQIKQAKIDTQNEEEK